MEDKPEVQQWEVQKNSMMINEDKAVVELSRFDREFKNTFRKEDVDEFTATRQHFEAYNCYTRDPFKSKVWHDFWKEERKRIRYGYNIGRDYITGYHYFYLNYSPILKVEVLQENEFGQNKSTRIDGFPDFWDGDYDFFHYTEEAENVGQHALLFGSRGKGKSLKSGSMLVRNYDHFRSSKNYAFAYTEGFLNDDGIINKAWAVMDFNAINTPWGKSRDQEDSGLHRKATKLIKRNGIWVPHPKSYNSEIIGVVIGDRIDKARGKRGKLIIWEEFGMFKKSDKAWMMNRPSMEDGKNTFGLMLGIGTGGTEGAGFEGADKMFRNPRHYNIYPVRNKWEEGRENTEVGYFFPAYINYGACYDKDTGVSDTAKALKHIMEDRANVANAEDPTTLTRRKAEYPLTPTEVLMKISHSIFPKEELFDQESEIENHPKKYSQADFIGRLQLNTTSQKFEFKFSDDKPITHFPHSNNKNMEGAIVIYEHPKTDTDENPFYNRYWAGIDSYDHDESSTTSLGSVFIMDLWTMRIVAEYTGRPKTAEEFYENARRMLLYYNAKANIENHNKGIFTYFKQKNSEYLISDEPQVVRETLSDATLKKSGRRKMGTTPSVPVQQYARGLVVKWLLDTTNNPNKPEEMNIHNFRSLAAIKEMINWTDEGNYDRIDALSMLMLIIEDAKKYNLKKMEDKTRELAHDPHFQRFFKKHNIPRMTKVKISYKTSLNKFATK